MQIHFVVPGAPVAKGRARSFFTGKMVRHYTPEKTVKYENWVKQHAAQAMKQKPIFDAPCCLDVVLYMPIPSSWSNKKRLDADSKKILPATKPDCSNIIKAIEDALNEVVWTDDKLICDLKVKKFYSSYPRAEILVSAINLLEDY
jgi:Holliday junction resolvase RusA-like endonuclease